MPQESKSEREKRQARGFLRGLIIFDDVETVSPDPPDIRVLHNGSTILSLELTEYHVDDELVTVNSRWAKTLWPKVDDRRKREAALRGIDGLVCFSDKKLPALRGQKTDQFAEEMVRLAERISPRLGDSGELKISFLPCTDVNSFPYVPGYPSWELLPSEDWPLISQHIGSVTFLRTPEPWPRWICPQTDVGFAQMAAERFRRIFDAKDAKVREACRDVRRFPPDVPLWLVIVSDMLNDVTSHLFPTAEGDGEKLFSCVRESEYDFSTSAFTNIWLYSEFSGQKLRLFPTPGSET